VKATTPIVLELPFFVLFGMICKQLPIVHSSSAQVLAPFVHQQTHKNIFLHVFLLKELNLLKVILVYR
jgi:hypothetical protein